MAVTDRKGVKERRRQFIADEDFSGDDSLQKTHAMWGL